MLIWLNHQVSIFANMRSTASIVTLPVQYLIHWPMQLVHWVQVSFTTQQELLEENATLRARQLLLQAKVQKMVALEQENAQLRGLANTSNQLDGKVVIARVFAINMDNFSQVILIDKGKRENVYVGQPVLDAYGVMGEVIDVGPTSSQVLLITDTRGGIPVQDNRTGIRAIAVGLGFSNKLSLLHVPDTTDVKVGDLLVTSGLGGRFPYGYPVGTISSIDRKTGEGFSRVEIVPSAKIDRAQQVLLVWPVLPTKVVTKNDKAKEASKVAAKQAEAEKADQPLPSTEPEPNYQEYATPTKRPRSGRRSKSKQWTDE
jgi:rod shape-determining protein MreC